MNGFWLLRCMDFATLYFFSVNTMYVLIVGVALVAIRKKQRVQPFAQQLDVLGFSPPISIIVPAYNEEKVIVDSVLSLLRLQYSKHEVIVVNDGSKDETMRVLGEALFLVPVAHEAHVRFSGCEILGVYRSRVHGNLTVIDKSNGGKADSLNVGSEFSNFEHVCAVDADSILDPDALLKIVTPFIENPYTVASGGTIRVGNGSEIKHSRVVSADTPREWISLLQIVEYTRSFFCGRVGWSTLNATLIISGAFGVFKKEALFEVGGYRTDTVGEDMDLVVRLHRHFRGTGRKYAIVFLPDPICWTEVPSDWGTLYRQRKRWQIGLLQSLFHNRDILFHRKFGVLGFVAYPYMILVDLLGPFIEMVAYLMILIGFACGMLTLKSQLLFFAVSVLYGMIISVGALLINELFFPTYQNLRSIVHLLAASVLENLGYRQLTSFWRISAMVAYARGNVSWGKMNRRGMN